MLALLHYAKTHGARRAMAHAQVMAQSRSLGNKVRSGWFRSNATAKGTFALSAHGTCASRRTPATIGCRRPFRGITYDDVKYGCRFSDPRAGATTNERRQAATTRSFASARLLSRLLPDGERTRLHVLGKSTLPRRLRPLRRTADMTARRHLNWQRRRRSPFR